MEARTSDSAGTELSELDDPAFLAERRRVRALLERTPEREVTSDLQERVHELEEEFIRRARLAWRRSS